MHPLTRLLGAAAVLAAVVTTAQASNVIPTNFDAYGTSVSGYQDFFTGSTLNPAWQYVGGNASSPFSLPGDDTLHMGPADVNSDPNKLLYNPNGVMYDASNQTVLAEIRVIGGTSDGSDGFRGGVGTNADSGNGQGYDVLFRQPGQPGFAPNSTHFNLLDDQKAWGPTVGGSSYATWDPSTYYWLELDSNGSSVTGKVWAADGTTPESQAATSTWSNSSRSGLAGLVSNSIGGQGIFQVNYVLIEANGLPTITAGASPVPEPASLALAGIGAALLAGVRLRRRLAIA